MIKALITTALLIGGTMAQAEDKVASVVEIATFELAEGVNHADFANVDARVEAEHVSQQPGFVSRQTGATDTGWIAIVHWENVEDAQASMDDFSSAPAAAKFMEMMDASTMAMTRYDINK